MFYWNVTPGHIEKITISVFFWLWLEHTRENFWDRHMLCRIFRPIDWYHSLVPKTFFLRSYSGFRSFFGIPFFAHNSKTAHFWDMVPILSSHFFSISYQMAYSLFWGVDLFWKLSLLLQFSLPVLLNLTRSEESLFWKKTVASVNFHFHVIDNGEWDGCRNGGYLMADI